LLKGKKILLGVTGSIAAYKSALLTRLLVKEGAYVQVIMTSSAHDFITPLTLATLSKHPALTDFIRNNAGEWNNHVELGLWADLMVIAPASANTLAKMANGQCDNLLLAIYLSAKCPVMIAPAMDLDMYAHPSTKNNLMKIGSYGNILIEAEDGELASGLKGLGRMSEPEHILKEIQGFFLIKKRFKGKKVLINAGPTYEPIDPVRFIGNHSSGKMGYAIAERFAEMGAKVELVSGPTYLDVKSDNIHITRVTSAKEMLKACQKHFKSCDIAVLAAAVADYSPSNFTRHKIKKKTGVLSMELASTPDIAKELGKVKKKNQVLVGFALETENETRNAAKKLKEKNFDLIVLNSLQDKGAGFGHDTNKISIFRKDNKKKYFELKSKKDVANDIINEILEYIG
jgi:phosphopantothenoylcysteine decarboxylase/phosphopantothenate--cysteine ligase